MLKQHITKKHIYTSEESRMFRKLSREDKLQRLLDFCRKNKRIPRPFKDCTDEEERYLGNFYFNNKSQLNKYASAFPENEIVIFAEIETYVTRKMPRLEKLNRVLEYCIQHSHAPSQVSEDENEKKIALMLSSVKVNVNNEEVLQEELDILNKISKYKNNFIKSRKEKLTDVLAFCKENGRTPRQHVVDKTEKRMGEFFTTVKMAHKQNKLDAECVALISEIMNFSTPTREQRLLQLAEFVKTHHHTPKINSDDTTERQLAGFFTKMKIQQKNDTLTAYEREILYNISEDCNFKSRYEKIHELLVYCISIKRTPRLNSNESVERKNAMFLNNMKQLKRKNKLNLEESQILSQITTSQLATK